MRISAGQIRAARGLLDWSREELAQTSGLSYNTIRNLESGTLSPRETTAVRLCRAFEGAGIYFTEDDGIRRERTDIKIIRGAEGPDTFLDSIMHTIKRRGGDIVGVFRTQEMIIRSLGLLCEEDISRLKVGAGFGQIRFIFSDFTGGASATSVGRLRSVPKYCAGPVCYLVYGNKYAIVQEEGSEQFQYIVFNDVEMAMGYRAHFETLWHIATPVVPAGEAIMNIKQQTKA